ncbi:MAG: OmpA family protein [Pseudomonadales bacterium]
MSRTQGLWLCLLLLALLLFFCVHHHAPVIETDLAERSRAVLNADNMSWAHIDLDGRDVTLTGAAPSEELRDRAGDLAGAVWGVRTVNNELRVDSTAAVPSVAADPAVHIPVDPTAAAAAGPIVAAGSDLQAERAAPSVDSVEAAVGDDAATEAEDNNAAAAEIAPVDAAQAAAANCQQEFNRLLEGKTSVLFESSRSAIKTTGLELLQQIAIVANSCPGVDIEIGGHTDASGSDELNQRLSEERASAVKKALAELGMTENEMSAVGYGASKPIADNANVDGRAKNRRVELIVKGL